MDNEQVLRNRRGKVLPDVYVIGNGTCTLWSGILPKVSLFLSTCMLEKMLMQESSGGPDKELQRTLGLYDATITSNLLSPPVAPLSALS